MWNCETTSSAPTSGRVPRVVAGLLVLLVRGLVFLVHDDDTEIPNRREQRRSRADHDPDLTAREGAVAIAAEMNPLPETLVPELAAVIDPD